MTVFKQEGCEYSELVADLMVTLDDLEQYTLKIWTNGKELPHKFRTSDELVFMQEGIRASKQVTKDKSNIVYIWYDTIDNMVVLDYEN